MSIRSIISAVFGRLRRQKRFDSWLASKGLTKASDLDVWNEWLGQDLFEDDAPPSMPTNPPVTPLCRGLEFVEKIRRNLPKGVVLIYVDPKRSARERLKRLLCYAMDSERFSSTVRADVLAELSAKHHRTGFTKDANYITTPQNEIQWLLKRIEEALSKQREPLNVKAGEDDAKPK